jgi:hypothetical protein
MAEIKFDEAIEYINSIRRKNLHIKTQELYSFLFKIKDIYLAKKECIINQKYQQASEYRDAEKDILNKIHIDNSDLFIDCIIKYPNLLREISLNDILKNL